MYPNVRDKENIVDNINSAMLNTSIYREINSTQALMKYVVADTEILVKLQKIIKFRRFLYLLITLTIIGGLFYFL